MHWCIWYFFQHFTRMMWTCVVRIRMVHTYMALWQLRLTNNNTREKKICLKYMYVTLDIRIWTYIITCIPRSGIRAVVKNNLKKKKTFRRNSRLFEWGTLCYLYGVAWYVRKSSWPCCARIAYSLQNKNTIIILIFMVRVRIIYYIIFSLKSETTLSDSFFFVVFMQCTVVQEVRNSVINISMNNVYGAVYIENIIVYL
jgi:hypothetical protein